MQPQRQRDLTSRPLCHLEPAGDCLLQPCGLGAPPHDRSDFPCHSSCSDRAIRPSGPEHPPSGRDHRSQHLWRRLPGRGRQQLSHVRLRHHCVSWQRLSEGASTLPSMRYMAHGVTFQQNESTCKKSFASTWPPLSQVWHPPITWVRTSIHAAWPCKPSFEHALTSWSSN